MPLVVLAVCLKRTDIGDERDLLDITRGTGGDAGAPFAPSWAILRPALAKLRQGGAVAEQGWAEYVPAYLGEMRASYRAHRPAWDALLARGRVVLGCHCRDRARCHRGLVAGILVKLGAVDHGELPAATRQGRLPGLG